MEVFQYILIDSKYGLLQQATRGALKESKAM